VRSTNDEADVEQKLRSTAITDGDLKGEVICAMNEVSLHQ